MAGQANGFSFQNYKQKMKNAARGNQFALEITVPFFLKGTISEFTNDNEADCLRYKTKAFSIPSLNLDTLETSFRGRKCKIAGDRTLDPITFTVYLTDGLPERKFFEAWQDAILGVDCADRAPVADVNYFSDLTGYQMNQNGEIKASYIFEDAWPQSIGETAFDSDSGDILTLDITMEMNNVRSAGIRQDKGLVLS